MLPKMTIHLQEGTGFQLGTALFKVCVDERGRRDREAALRDGRTDQGWRLSCPPPPRES
jgi:hypothetical protein